MSIELNKDDVAMVMTATAQSMAEQMKLEIQRLISMESEFSSGEYVNSVKVRETDEGWEVYTEKEYGPYLEYGTGLFVAAGHGTPHLIVPTTKKALSWIDRRTGKRVFAKSVKGIHPRFYFTRGNDIVQAKYSGDITSKIARYISGQAKIEMAERFEKTGLVIGRTI